MDDCQQKYSMHFIVSKKSNTYLLAKRRIMKFVSGWFWVLMKLWASKKKCSLTSLPYKQDLKYHRIISYTRLSSLTFAFFKYKTHPDKSKLNIIRFPRSPAMRQCMSLLATPLGWRETSDVVGRHHTSRAHDRWVNKTDKQGKWFGGKRYGTLQ
jgi:hypothetical protein